MQEMTGVGNNGKEYGLSRSANYAHHAYIEPALPRPETRASGVLKRKKHWRRSAVLDAFNECYGNALRHCGYTVAIVDVLAYEELQPLTYGVQYRLERDETALPGVFLALIVQRRSAGGEPYLSGPDGVRLPETMQE
jgi:hypothetical protein